MDVRFKYNEPAEAEKIYFEQIFAEKPGGGIVSNCTVDYPPSTPVYETAYGQYAPIYQFKTSQSLSKGGTNLRVYKNFFGENSASALRGLFIAYGKEAVEIADYAITPLGDYAIILKNGFSKDIKSDSILYIAKEASEDNAEVDWESMGGKPIFVTGDWVYANQGDQAVRLINGANLRKETANIASEVAALLPGINLV